MNKQNSESLALPTAFRVLPHLLRLAGNIADKAAKQFAGTAKDLLPAPINLS